MRVAVHGNANRVARNARDIRAREVVNKNVERTAM
jgi:hypothetical protein